jgi:hypothetical protein
LKRRIRTLLPVLLDLVVPTAGYFLLHAAGVSDVWALTVAGSAAGILTVVNTIRNRHVDLLGGLVFVELALSVVLAAVTSDARLILARAAFYLAIGGGVTLISAFAGRPLTYSAAEPMATKGDPERARAYAAVWDNSAAFRRIHTQISASIGGAMLAYAVLRLVIIYTARSVAEAVWAQEIPGLVLIVASLLLIRLRVPALSRLVDAEQAKITQPDDPDIASVAAPRAD